MRTSGLAFGSSLSQHRRPGEGAGICIGETGEQGGGCEKTNTTDFVSSCHAYRVRISPHDNILECKIVLSHCTVGKLPCAEMWSPGQK